MSARRARKIGRPGAVVVLVLGSVAAHGALLGTLEVLDLIGLGSGSGEYAPPKEKELAATPAWEVETTCEAEATLAAAARVSVCATPLAGKTCLDDSAVAWRRDLDKCHQVLAEQQDDPKVEIALLDEAALALIQPMAIMPMLEEEEQKKFEDKQQEKLEQKAVEIMRVETQVARNAQIVEVMKPNIEMAPDKARYLSEYDTRVERQTVSRGSTEEMAHKPGPRDLPVAEQNNIAPQKPQEHIDTEIENERGTGALDMRKPGEQQVTQKLPTWAPGVNDGSKDPLNPDGLAPRDGQAPRMTQSNPAHGEGGSGGELGKPRVPDLRPSEELLTRVTGGGSVDKIDDADEGEETALNSKRWKFAGFFNRMKRQVAQNWHPDRVYLQRDPRGNVYGTRDRITVLKVQLKTDGSVEKIYVQQGCGVDFLDDEAVRAFRAAQPFPNPPTGLKSGENISFSFGFHFQIGGSRDRWRIFRYQ
jgi:TonB family protein